MRIPEAGIPATRALLGTSEARLEEALGRWWSERAAEAWRIRYQGLEKNRRRLRELEERLAKGALSVDEAWERADLVEDFRGEAEALPLFEEVLDRDQAHPRAHLSVGRILVLRDDAQAVGHLERAAAGDQRLAGPAYNLLLLYWTRQGRREEGQAFRTRLAAWSRGAAEGRAERQGVSMTDRFAPHGLDASTIARLGEQLGRIPEVQEVWLVRKVVRHFPEQPLYVFAVLTGAWRYRDARATGRLLRRLREEVSLPGDVILIDVRVEKMLGEHVRGVAGAPVYQRKT